MELTAEQQKTIRHLKHYHNIVEPQQIVDWCFKKLALPRKGKGKSRTDTRVHTVKHYQGIIAYLAKTKV